VVDESQNGFKAVRVIKWPLTLKVQPTVLFWLFAVGIAYTASVLFFINERLRYT
jgi:hypothetical protein